MTTKTITIQLSALRTETVEAAAAKLLTHLRDGGGYEMIEGVLIDPPGLTFQLGDGTTWPENGVGWRVMEYGDGPAPVYQLGVKSLRYGGKTYLKNQYVDRAVWVEMPPSVQAFWEPSWLEW